MKKSILLILFVGITVVSFAQLTLGGHFAYNSTWLMNKQVFDEGPEMDIAVSYGSYYGVFAGYYFSDNFGVEINFNPNKIEQKYEGSVKYFFSDERNTYNASTVMRTLDVPILMKFGKSSYFEIGPLVQLVNKVTYSRTFEETNIINPGWYNDMAYGFENASSVGVKSNFKGTGFGVTMGFGANFNIIDDVLKLNFGARFNYVLSDLEGVNALGLTKDSNFVPDDEKVNFKNNPLYGGLKIGLVYFFE